MCEYCGRPVRGSKIAYTQVFTHMRKGLHIQTAAHLPAVSIPPMPLYRSAITHRKCTGPFRVVTDIREAL
ncbi:MAG TPA: hypothetical protein VMN56_03570 [Casimicrobiaceae bacterium]|nr:hypothetical protein [Casimicrobiaceae bacterium]